MMSADQTIIEALPTRFLSLEEYVKRYLDDNNLNVYFIGYRPVWKNKDIKKLSGFGEFLEYASLENIDYNSNTSFIGFAYFGNGGLYLNVTAFEWSSMYDSASMTQQQIIDWRIRDVRQLVKMMIKKWKKLDTVVYASCSVYYLYPYDKSRLPSQHMPTTELVFHETVIDSPDTENIKEDFDIVSARYFRNDLSEYLYHMWYEWHLDKYGES